MLPIRVARVGAAVRAPFHRAALITFLVSTLAAASAQASPPLFDAAFRSFAAGPGARALALADVTHDGRLDVVVANSSAPSVSVLVNAGDGTLEPAVPYGAGPDYTEHIQLADINGDGRLDVVYIDGFSDATTSVGVLLGGTSGGFVSPVTYADGLGAVWLVLADMNGDGILDAVTTSGDSFSSESVAILPGDGHGHFGPRQVVSFFQGGEMTCVSAADLNGDGRADLAVIASNGTFVYVRLALAGGGFGPMESYAIGGYPAAFAVGDVNGDGHPDIVAGGDPAAVLFGNGDGTFQPRVFLGTGGGEPIIADLDGDGVPDIAFTGGSVVVVVRGLGGGAFAPPKTYVTGFESTAITAGDLDGDGTLDLVTANDYSATVAVLHGNGDGSFGRARAYGTSQWPSWSDAGDLDGDGRADLAVACGTAGVDLFSNTGGGQFAPEGVVPANSPQAVLLRDLDGDGRADLVSAGAGLEVRLRDGAGFRPAQAYEDSVPFHSLAIGDVDGDGIPDLIAPYSRRVNNVRPFNWIPGTVLYVFHGAGDGSFSAETTYTVGNTPDDVQIGDVNSDGRNDVVVAVAGDASVAVLLGDASGRLRPAVPYATAGSVHALALADFDGDGVTDLVCAGANDAQVLRGTGGGAFGSATEIGSFPDIASVAALDIDRDGHADVIAMPAYANGVVVLRGAGDGTFAAPEVYGTGVGPQRIAVGDLNGDGIADLAVPNLYSANVAILLTRLAVPIAVPGPPAAPARLQLAVRPSPLLQGGTVTVTLLTREPARFDVLDAAGRRVWAEAVDGGPGVRTMAWPIGRERAGVYFVQVTQGGERVRQRVVIVR